MSPPSSSRLLRSSLPWFLAASVFTASSAMGQSRLLFSLDWQGPTVGTPDPLTASALTEGDLLQPLGDSLPLLGPFAEPVIAIPHGAGGLGLPPGCVGHLGGTPCTVEVDAVSLGRDSFFLSGAEIRPGEILFGVDEFAVGVASGPAPNLRSESLVQEAASDTFTNAQSFPPPPLSPTPGFAVRLFDGNGARSSDGRRAAGLGVLEPSAPSAGPVDDGDNVDAFDVDEPVVPAGTSVYFSLDAGFLDPLEGVANSGSAAASGFVGGDVLVTSGGGAPMVWASASELGLDLVAGADTDDLDALILFDNGNGVFDRPTAPYDWLSGGSDMVVFSVRRGSAVIGQLDSIFGLPIEPGDLLVPAPASSLSSLPGLFVPAEALGLATERSGTASTGDDLDSADTLFGSVYDCDQDGVEDSIGIVFGVAVDASLDGVPDSCQPELPVGTPFCSCSAAVEPCANSSPGAGCANVFGGAARLTGSGSSSLAADDLVLTTSGMVPNTFALTFMGSDVRLPAQNGNGLICLTGALFRFPVFPTGAGTGSLGPGIAAISTSSNPPAGQIATGATWHFQTFYRDIGGACTANFNMSSALTVTFE